MAADPEGMAGTTQPTAADAQSTRTIAISARNETPMSETNPMIQRSTLP